jgi:hypothetical protein
MEDIALVALPPTVDSDVESDSGSGSAEEPEVDGTSEPTTGLVESAHEESKPDTFEGIMTPKGDSVPSPNRVRLYILRNNEWEDQGTGLCNCAVSCGCMWITVTSEDDPDIKLMDCYLHTADEYQRGPDILILWMEVLGKSLALKFQKPEGCTSVWNILQKGGDVDEAQKEAHTELTSHEEEEKIDKKRNDSNPIRASKLSARLYLEPAAAANPVMDFSPSVPQFLPDLEGTLRCIECALSCWDCVCVLV